MAKRSEYRTLHPCVDVLMSKAVADFELVCTAIQENSDLGDTLKLDAIHL